MTGGVGVVVVDDQAPFRAAARAVLRLTDGFEWLGESSSGEEALEVVRDLRPALVLMDINMPGIDGIEATRQLVATDPSVVVVLCSTYAVGDLPEDAAASGARAYVHKEQLGPAVLRAVWSGGEAAGMARFAPPPP